MSASLPASDQTGHPFKLDHAPKRIVSLVPSQTELLYHLGLDQEVVGITKFCIHPESWFKSKTRVGGTKDLDIGRIRALQPDLIIGNKEENERSQIELLREEFPVWLSDISTLDEALEMIRSIGALTGKSAESRKITESITTAFEELSAGISRHRPLRVSYFIWKNPLMAAAGGTFIDSMISACGWTNVFGPMQRYPEVSPEMIRDAAPDLLLFSSEPYPFKDQDIAEFSALFPESRCLIADGELFSWYGSRMLEAPAYFTELVRKVAKADGFEGSLE